MASGGIPVPSVHNCKSIFCSIPGMFAFRKSRNVSVSIDWNLKVAIYFLRKISNAGLPTYTSQRIDKMGQSTLSTKQSLATLVYRQCFAQTLRNLSSEISYYSEGQITPRILLVHPVDLHERGKLKKHLHESDSTYLSFNTPKELETFLIGNLRIYIIWVHSFLIGFKFSEFHLVLEPFHFLI